MEWIRMKEKTEEIRTERYRTEVFLTEKTKTQKMVTAALLAALTCVATMIIKIPSPLKGYINLGDCVVLLSGWILPPGYGFLAAGLGSAMADVFSGYAAYAPATFVIKGLMALIACSVSQILAKKCSRTASEIISGIMAEVIMVLGYFGFEGILYGFGPSAVNIPANTVQGIAGLILGCELVRIFQKKDVYR